MERTQDRSPESFDRFRRRSLMANLFVVVVLGLTVLAMTLGVAPVRGNLGWWLLPLGLALLVAVPTSVLGRRWGADSPAARVVEEDEWRRSNLARASRVGFVGVLAIQWPLALLVGWADLASPRGEMAMGAATVVVGLAVFMALFLVLDRD
ncbi:MAG: hypothetical protein R3190_04025 [Thermoanaerobaculia bacterium]|nr:hypothetical protein [Thermoanaerobaculia bacterium]